jgi:hypothetical protein
MTQQEFLKRLEAGYQNNVEISRRKNSDYAGDNDAFQNFMASTVVGTSVERGMLVRMMDKIVRVSNLIDREAQVKDEAIADTLSDLANYAMIMKVYIDDKNEKKCLEARKETPEAVPVTNF